MNSTTIFIALKRRNGKVANLTDFLISSWCMYSREYYVSDYLKQTEEDEVKRSEMKK